MLFSTDVFRKQRTKINAISSYFIFLRMVNGVILYGRVLKPWSKDLLGVPCTFKIRCKACMCISMSISPSFLKVYVIPKLETTIRQRMVLPGVVGIPGWHSRSHSISIM